MKDAQPFLQKRAIGNFAKADAGLGKRLQQAVDKYNAAK